MKAYSYLRISTSEQIKGDGIARQLRSTRKYCDEIGLELDERPIQDLGLSGYKGENLESGALGLFVQGVTDRDIPTPCALIVENLDRLSRLQPEDALFWLLSATRKGIEIHTTMDRQIYRRGDLKAMKILQSTLTFERGHEESDTKSNRVREAWEKKRKRARKKLKPLTRLVPEWLTVTKGRKGIITVPERVEIVKRIFKEVIEGRGRRAIATCLNEEGQRPWGRKNKRGVRWHYSYVTKIVKSRAVLGEYQPHRMVDGVRIPDGSPILGYFPAVVSQEEWDAAQAALFTRHRPVTRVPSSTNVPRNLVPGLVHINGHKAIWSNKGKRTTSGGKRGTKKEHLNGGYALYYQAIDPTTGKTIISMPAQAIEDMILSGLRKADGNRWISLIRSAMPSLSPGEVKKAQLESDCVRLRAALGRLVDALSLGIGGTETLAKKIADTERDLKRAETQVQEIPEKEAQIERIAPDVSELRELAEAGNTTDPEIRNLISQRLRSLFVRVDIGRTYQSLMDQREPMTPIVFPPDVFKKPVANGWDDPALIWALLTPRAATGVRILVASHAPHPAVLIALRYRDENPIRRGSFSARVGS